MKQENNHMFIQEGEVVNSETQTNSPQPGMTTNTETGSEIIKCARCGADMKKSARYCMKCGNLNYDNQENEFMKQYAINNIKKDYVGGLETAKNSGLEVPKEVLSYPYKACLITNVIIFLLIVVCLIALWATGGNINSVSSLIVLLIIFSIIFFYLYAYQRMLIKAAEPWWSIFVPFYNFYVYFKVALGSGWFFLLTFIPIVGFIVNLVAEYMIAEKFYKNGWLMIFFPFIMIPVIGFSKDAVYKTETGMSLKNYRAASLDTKGKSSVEKKYRAKKRLLSLLIFIIIVGALWFGRDYVIKIYEFILEQLEFLK